MKLPEDIRLKIEKSADKEDILLLFGPTPIWWTVDVLGSGYSV